MGADFSKLPGSLIAQLVYASPRREEQVSVSGFAADLCVVVAALRKVREGQGSDRVTALAIKRWADGPFQVNVGWGEISFRDGAA